MKNFKTIKDIIWKYRWRYFWGIAFLLLVDTLQLFIPILTGDLSDALYAGTASRETVIKTALGIIGLGLGIGGFRFCWRYFIIGTAMRVEYDLKNRLYGHLLHLSQNYYNEHKTGDLMAHLTNDLNAVRMCMGQGVMQVADALYLTTSTVIILMGKVDVKLTLLAILPLPFVTLTIITLGRVIHRRFARVQETFSNLSDTVQENFSGLKVIKSFVQEDAEIKKFEAKALDCYDAHLSLTKLRAFFFSMLAFITGLTYVIVIGLGGKMVVDGSITVGNFVTFIGYLGTLSWPVRALGFVINQVQRGSASMGRINKILAAKAEIREDDDPVSSDLSGDIVFQGVSYSYPNTELKALDNINLTVPAELKASGQMLLAVVSFGIARVIGNFGGGLLADAMGYQKVFIVSAVICAVTFAVFAPYYLRRKPLNGEN